MEDNTIDFLKDFQNITYSPLPELFEKEVSQETEPYIEIMQSGKRIYQCAHSDCGKTFKYKSEADRHLIIHKKGKPYSCSVLGCNKSFKRQETLEEHIIVHGNELPFLCDELGCGKRLASKPALRYHRLRHKNNRKYRCDIEGCNRSFLTMSHLKQHQTSSLHCDKSPSDISDKTSYKRFKTQPETDFSEVTLTSSESMWEVKSQYKDTSSSDECMQEMYEMLQNTLAENQLLKQKLQENQQTSQDSFEYAEPVSFSDTIEPSSSFDKFELAIFEFLNETDKN